MELENLKNLQFQSQTYWKNIIIINVNIIIISIIVNNYYFITILRINTNKYCYSNKFVVNIIIIIIIIIIFIILQLIIIQYCKNIINNLSQ